MSRPRRAAGHPDRPKKPYPDFPLFPHATRRWAKKIRGKLHYFGPWDDPDGALKKYQEQRDDLHAGLTPRVQADGFTVRDLLNAFMTAKQMKRDSGELSERAFKDYLDTCKRIGAAFGLTRLVMDLRPTDFDRLRATMAQRWGPVRLGNVVQRVRCVFRWAHESELIDKPVRFGPEFKKPSKKTMRQAREAKGPRMFEAAELRKIIKAAGVPLRAMVLLGVNCGFGNSDVGKLPLSALDLKGGWIDFPRPKTGIPRRCPLWPETVKALREAIAERPAPECEAAAALVFVTRWGQPWAKDTSDTPVSNEMRRVLDALGINGNRSFYALRHTFATVGGESRDQVAVNAIMGHVPPSDDMPSVYRERVSDERLRAVTDHVRAWLFGRKVKR
jgi:integrase